MSDNTEDVQMEGSSVQEARQTISFLGDFQEFRIDRELLWRKVPVLRDELNPWFPRFVEMDTESFKAFLLWIHEDRLPMLHVVYHEKDGVLHYYGYNFEMVYKLATWFSVSLLANNIMDIVRKVHISFSVGFTKEEITRIYAEQIPHLGLSFFAALWFHLEDTRPNNYMKVTTKAERVALLKNETIAQDLREHARPWFPGNQSACMFHLHTINQPCSRNYNIEVGLWVVDKDGKVKDLHDWRIQNFTDPTPTERSSNL